MIIVLGFLISCSPEIIGNFDSETDIHASSQEGISSNDKYGVKELFCRVYQGENDEIERRNQSIAVANNRLFVFGDNNYVFKDGNHMTDNVRIYDLNTFSEIATAYTGVENTHHNNAQFLNVYYSEDDVYPLLLLSRGDYADIGSSYEEFYVMRIVESDGVYTFQRIKTLTCSIEQVKYNGSWVYSPSGYLFLYTYTNGTWRLTEDNNLCLIAFPITKEQLKSSDILQYENCDIEFTHNLPYAIMQGASCVDGVIYMALQGLGNINGKVNDIGYNLLVGVNERTGYIDSVMKMDKQNIEPEGIAIYDKALYVSYHDGLASEGSVCMLIEKYFLL